MHCTQVKVTDMCRWDRDAPVHTLLQQAECVPEDGPLPVRVLAIQLLHVGAPQEEFAAIAS